MPLSESEYSTRDSVWLYVIGLLIYLFTWSLILGMAVWQISAQVDYNFSQVNTNYKIIASNTYKATSVILEIFEHHQTI